MTYFFLSLVAACALACAACFTFASFSRFNITDYGRITFLGVGVALLLLLGLLLEGAWRLTVSDACSAARPRTALVGACVPPDPASPSPSHSVTPTKK